MPDQTLLSLFKDRARAFSDRVALKQRRGDSWVDITWKEWQTTAEKIAAGLASLGVQPGDKVCILSNTRAEWVFAETGITMAGAVLVTIYQSNTAEQSC